MVRSISRVYRRGGSDAVPVPAVYRVTMGKCAIWRAAVKAATCAPCGPYSLWRL